MAFKSGPAHRKGPPAVEIFEVEEGLVCIPCAEGSPPQGMCLRLSPEKGHGDKTIRKAADTVVTPSLFNSGVLQTAGPTVAAVTTARAEGKGNWGYAL